MIVSSYFRRWFWSGRVMCLARRPSGDISQSAWMCGKHIIIRFWFRIWLVLASSIYMSPFVKIWRSNRCGHSTAWCSAENYRQQWYGSLRGRSPRPEILRPIVYVEVPGPATGRTFRSTLSMRWNWGIRNGATTSSYDMEYTPQKSLPTVTVAVQNYTYLMPWIEKRAALSRLVIMIYMMGFPTYLERTLLPLTCMINNSSTHVDTFRR